MQKPGNSAGDNGPQQELDGLLGAPIGVVDEVRVREIQAMVTSDLAPVRPRANPIVFAIGFFGILLGLGLASVYLMPSDGWNQMSVLVRWAVFTTMAACAGLLSLALSLQMVPGSRVLASSGLMIGSSLVLLLLVLASIFQVVAQPHFVQTGLVCMRLGTPFAVPAAILYAFLLRQGLTLRPKSAGAMAGALAGLTSMAVLEMHCPNSNLLHIVVWHMGFPAVGALTGLAVSIAGERLRLSQPAR